jgi:hypothetical protein
MTNYKKMLGFQLEALSRIVNIPHTRETAKETGAKYYLHLDNYPMYGGYNLILVDVQSGGHNPFSMFPSCGGRVNAETMYNMIKCFIYGMKYTKENSYER